MKKVILLPILYLFFFTSLAQKVFDYRNERHKFNRSLIFLAKKSFIKSMVISGSEEFIGKYLGKFITNSKRTYYLVASSYVFDIGKSEKTENHVFIYDKKLRYIGYYYLKYYTELPTRLYKNKLYFRLDGCSESVIINFNQGIPRAINLSCSGTGNFYEFKS